MHTKNSSVVFYLFHAPPFLNRSEICYICIISGVWKHWRTKSVYSLSTSTATLCESELRGICGSSSAQDLKCVTFFYQMGNAGAALCFSMHIGGLFWSSKWQHVHQKIWCYKGGEAGSRVFFSGDEPWVVDFYGAASAWWYVILEMSSTRERERLACSIVYVCVRICVSERSSQFVFWSITRSECASRVEIRARGSSLARSR